MKDFLKFQDANEDDIEMKYQTSEQRRNFKKDSQPGWVAAARATGFVAPRSKISFQYSPSSRLAIHLAALATNVSKFMSQDTKMLLKSSKLFLFFGLPFVLSIFQGCTAIPEATADYDFVIGGNYVAPVKKVSDTKIPENILLVPIPQNMAPNYYREFVSKFVSYYKERSLTLAPGWENRTSAPTPNDVQGWLEDTGCDAILFLKLDQPSVYQPLRIKADVTLKLVKSDQIIWRGEADYDGGQEIVANSARRFLQRQLRRPNAPDKSLAILKNNYMFIHFAAWNLANRLNNLTTPPPDPNAPKEEKPKN